VAPVGIPPRRTLVWWAIGAIAAVLVVCIGGTRLRIRDDPRVTTPGGGNFAPAGIGYLDVPPGRPYSVGGLPICVDSPGRAVIDGVDSIDPSGGLKIDAFGVAPQRVSFSNDNRPLTTHGAEHGFDVTGPAIVDTYCGKGHVWLLLQYSKTTNETARNKGITVRYTSRGRHHSAEFGWEILLCAPADRWGDCRHDS